MKFILITIFTLTNLMSTANAVEKGLTFVTVGFDGCGFTTIQAAINTGVDRIRVVQGAFNENLTLINNSLKIIGGYANCSSAANDINITGRTMLNAGNIATGLFISHNMNTAFTFELSNFNIQSGRAGDSNLAGGILVHGNNQTGVNQTNIKLTNVDINSNDGSGLGVINVASAILKDIDIRLNSDFNGGGIYSSGSDITIYGASEINQNNADNFGGAIYLTNASNFKMYSTSDVNVLTGIQNNTATKKGGGIYADQASLVFIVSQTTQLPFATVGNNSSKVAIAYNEAGNESNDGDGGGVYITDTGTTFTINHGSILFNKATNYGGGIAMVNNANLVVTSPPQFHCNYDIQCNAIRGNLAGTNASIGGAIYANSGAQAFISHTFFDENHADFGSAIYSIGAGTALTIEGSVFHDHPSTGTRDGKYVVRAFTGSEITIGFSSFVNNDAVDATFGIFQAALTLAGVIVHDAAGGAVLTQNESTITSYCILSHDISSLTGTNFIQSSNSPFVNPSMNNFHLVSSTLAIDACDDSVYSPVFKDMDSEPRNFDVDTDNLDGAYDMGADEYWADEIIFKEGFDIPIDI